MTLKELQSMIKEEFDAYTNEVEDEVDVSVNPDADIDAEMGDDMGDMGAEGEEDVLRSIFDLLKTHFEGGEEEMPMGDEMPMDDAEGAEAPDSELDEISNVGFGDSGGKENPKTGGKDAGYKPFKKTSGHTGYDGSSKALQERFQKLANIIK
tara:strand:- start:858 stop:1313 length:456 start_codon:yes stop_codon:yes gene_type:complete